MTERKLRLNVASMRMRVAPKVTLLPADKMPQHQIAVWQRIAASHHRQVVLVNGLIIEATGELTVDEDIARSYDEKLQQSPTVEKV